MQKLHPQHLCKEAGRDATQICVTASPHSSSPPSLSVVDVLNFENKSGFFFLTDFDLYLMNQDVIFYSVPDLEVINTTFIQFKNIFSVWVFLCVHSASRGQKRVSDPLELGLQIAEDHYHVCAGNWTPSFWIRKWCFELLSHFSKLRWGSLSY